MSKKITNEIKFLVELDENRVPEKLTWTAQDGGVDAEEAKAMMLSIWDSKAKETLRIDLWTKEMPVDEMKLFFHQTLVAMSETFQRATGDEKMTATMKDFCDYFAEKLELKQLMFGDVKSYTTFGTYFKTKTMKNLYRTALVLLIFSLLSCSSDSDSSGNTNSSGSCTSDITFFQTGK